MTSPGQTHPPDRDRVRTALQATYVAFIAAGFVGASFAARIPQLRDRLELSPSELGSCCLRWRRDRCWPCR